MVTDQASYRLSMSPDSYLAHSDGVLPSTVMTDSRPSWLAQAAWVLGIDGRKLVKHVTLPAICDKLWLAAGSRTANRAH